MSAPGSATQPTKYSPQEMQNSGFDDVFGVPTVELLGYDSGNNVLRRLAVDSSGKIQTSSGLTQNSIVFAGSGGTLSQNNAKLSWTDTTSIFRLQGTLRLADSTGYMTIMNTSATGQRILTLLSEQATDFPTLRLVPGDSTGSTSAIGSSFEFLTPDNHRLLYVNNTGFTGRGHIFASDCLNGATNPYSISFRVASGDWTLANNQLTLQETLFSVNVQSTFSQFAAFEANSTAIPGSGGGTAFSWNYSAGGAECNIWNNFRGFLPTVSFRFSQVSGAGAKIDLFDIQGDATIKPLGGYRSTDGSAGSTATVAGLVFKNGLYTAGSFTGNPVVEVTGASQALTVNTKYIQNRTTLITNTLPASCAQGDQILIRGKGTGGWKIAQNSGQTIHGSSDTTTGTGGSVASQTRYDCVTLECITANTDFIILNQRGTLTIV